MESRWYVTRLDHGGWGLFDRKRDLTTPVGKFPIEATTVMEEIVRTLQEAERVQKQ